MIQMNKWEEFYCYDNNKDLIVNPCKKFELNEPIERMNQYGGVDLIFVAGLKTYLINLDSYNEEIIIKRRNTLNVGQKINKEYMNSIKKLHNGNLWYEAINFISKDSKI